MCDGPVSDDEVLYRSVRFEHVRKTEAGFQLSSEAFNDRAWKPSVDRQMLRNDANETKQSPSAGIVQLVTLEVRAISNIVQNPDDRRAPQVFYSVDVVARPIRDDDPSGQPPNLAHAQVESEPALATKSRFQKLKDALCRLAEKQPLVIEPVAD